ncbi:MAG: pectinesterase family protein [Mangrovibacterium sp.]
MTKTIKQQLFLLGFLVICFMSNAAEVNYELIVAKDGSGDYSSIQAAINDAKSFPDAPIIIRIKPGVYAEKVCIYAWNNKLSLIGENPENTIITFGDYFKTINLGRNSTFHTYTLKVESNDVHLENLTIINSAGKVGQAVALHLEGDRCSINNCRLLGNQDTLYADGEGARQYFSKCYIEGTTDFIFGQATALFDDCELHSKSDSYITAASNVKNQTYGFIFRNCRLTADVGVKNCFLGRPWRAYANVVFINCNMGEHIKAEGWSDWGNTNRKETAYYAEYQSTGKGANPTSRLSWTHQLSKKQAKKYTPTNIFAKRKSDIWNPIQ